MFGDSSQNITVRANESIYDLTTMQAVDSQATVTGGTQVTYQEEPVSPTMNRQNAWFNPVNRAAENNAYNTNSSKNFIFNEDCQLLNNLKIL